jgi:hypothetical protein
LGNGFGADRLADVDDLLEEPEGGVNLSVSPG